MENACTEKAKIILISGKAEHGKDETALILKKIFELDGKKACIIGNADYLKMCCEKYLGWDGVKDEAGRSLLTEEGDKFVRAGDRDPNTWVSVTATFMKAYQSRFDAFLVKDTRYKNEITYFDDNFKDSFILTVRVNRPGHVSKLTEEQLKNRSETELDDYIFDWVIDAKDINELTCGCVNMYEKVVKDEVD